jgi:hypothetical protein
MLLVIWGCGGGGAPKPPTDPDDPFTPGGNPGGGGGVVTAPSNVRGISGNGQIRVLFNKVAGAKGYNVYLSEDGSTFVRFNSNSPYLVNDISLLGLTNNQVYFVGVSAVFTATESNTSYAGGSPTAQPIIPSSEPVGPDPLADDVIVSVTAWSNANSPVATPTAPNDRRLLYSWESEPNSNVVSFRVRYFIAATAIGGQLGLPNSGADNLIYFDELVQSPGAFAELRDPDGGRYPDPAMGPIRNAVPVTPGLIRSEGTLDLRRNNNVIISMLNAGQIQQNLSVGEFLEVLQTDYNYSLDALGLGITPGGGLDADQNVLDGVDRVGFGIEISAIFRDGSVSTPDFAFSRCVDDVPEKVPSIKVLPFPNPGWDPEDPISSPVLPQVTWNRLRYPMGSDILDYGVIRRGALEGIPDNVTVIFLLSANGGNSLIFDNVEQEDPRELLGYSDSKVPKILRGRLYTYSVFAIDRAGREGLPSAGASFVAGPPLNQPPTLTIQVSQGTEVVFPEGDSTIDTGPSSGQVTIDFTGSADPDGDALTYFYQILPAQTTPTESASPVVTIPPINCVTGNTNVTLRVGIQDAADNLVTQDIPLTLVPGTDCGGG